MTKVDPFLECPSSSEGNASGWQAITDAPVLVPAELHIWRLSLIREPETLDSLAPPEVDRANRFKFERDRRRFINSRQGLRRILGQYLHCPAAAVTLDYSPYGKPYLRERPDLQFNLSHSGELALCGVALTQRLGIDIEQLRPLTHVQSLAKRCLSARELTQLPSPETDFLQIWTYKEAYLKAIGLGLSQSLQSIEIQLTPRPKFIEIPEPGPWQLHRLQPGDGYVAAVVSEGPATIRCFAA